MKNKLVVLLAVLGLAFSSCEKEQIFGDYDLKLNNQLEKITGVSYKEGSNSRYAILSYEKYADSIYAGVPDTLKIFDHYVSNPTFVDYDFDCDLDFTYSVLDLKKTSYYWVENESGSFSGDSKLNYEFVTRE